LNVAAGDTGVNYYTSDFAMAMVGGPAGPPGATSLVSPTPSVRVYRSTPQAIPNSAFTAISFDTVRYDQGAASPHWSVSNPTRLTCQVAGTYIIWGMAQFVPQAGGTNRSSALYLNGQTVLVGVGGVRGATTTGGSQDYPQANNPTIVKLNVGDYVELYVLQDSGVTANTNNSTATNQQGLELAMAMVGGPKGDTGIGVPTPVVNGQWIKGSGGAAVWSPIRSADLPGRPLLMAYVNSGGGFAWSYMASGCTFTTSRTGAGNHTITATAGFSSGAAPILVTAIGQSVVIGATQATTTTWNVFLTTPSAWTDAPFYVVIFDALTLS